MRTKYFRFSNFKIALIKEYNDLIKSNNWLLIICGIYRFELKIRCIDWEEWDCVHIRHGCIVLVSAKDMDHSVISD
jgi:hypothetical protein